MMKYIIAVMVALVAMVGIGTAYDAVLDHVPHTELSATANQIDTLRDNQQYAEALSLALTLDQSNIMIPDHARPWYQQTAWDKNNETVREAKEQAELGKKAAVYYEQVREANALATAGRYAEAMALWGKLENPGVDSPSNMIGPHEIQSMWNKQNASDDLNQSIKERKEYEASPQFAIDQAAAKEAAQKRAQEIAQKKADQERTELAEELRIDAAKKAFENSPGHLLALGKIAIMEAAGDQTGANRLKLVEFFARVDYIRNFT